MIVIAGDSWGCGEWTVTGHGSYHVSHKGLEDYLRKDNYDVINMSLMASSNWEIYERLFWFFNSNITNYLTKKIKTVLVFQTEWIRDLNIPKSTCVDANNGQRAVSCWYYRLSEIAVNNNVKIGLIGGCSDSEYFDNFEKEYPGLYIACQSVTNLCVNNDHRVDNPTFFARPANDLLKKMETHYKKYSSIETLAQDLDHAVARLQTWTDNPDWFYPCGAHANRYAHKKLYEFLIKRKVI